MGGRALVAVMAATSLLCAVPAAAQYNVARDQPYECNVDVMAQWTGLVDGVADSDTSPGCFATSNDPTFPKVVTIDLQRPCSISRIAVHNSTNGNTRGIVISCSEDGESYEKLREFIFPQGQAITLTHRFNDRPAQFVRVAFTNTWGGGLGGDNRIFVREVEVFGAPTGEAPVALPPAEPAGEAVAETRELRLFRRWAVEDDRPLTLAVLGDSLVTCGEGAWPQTVAERLEMARPEGGQVSVAAMTEPGLEPDATAGHLMLLADSDPDIVLVSFGTDITNWNQEVFRSALSHLVRRLLEETDAVVVLVGPLPGDMEQTDMARRVLQTMDRLADLLGLPLVRTEVALAEEGLTGEALRGDEGGASEAAGQVIATAVVELLVGP
ncbi:MAG: discoidin domain-containing protein [Armatimonadota bacterium]|nr:discoidin domain-containing protein [Armatimonadota bacterium]